MVTFFERADKVDKNKIRLNFNILGRLKNTDYGSPVQVSIMISPATVR
jgi:predicted component of type VI protein secretion system